MLENHYCRLYIGPLGVILIWPFSPYAFFSMPSTVPGMVSKQEFNTKFNTRN